MDTRIKDNESAAEYLAQAGLLARLEVTDDFKIVEKKVCPRCYGRGIYSDWHGVCFTCGGDPARKAWTVYTSIIVYARKVKSETSASARRATRNRERSERNLDVQRDWCEDNGYGRVTFDEKRAHQQARFEQAQVERAAKSAHVGTVGKREEFTLKVEQVIGLGYSSFGHGSDRQYTRLMKFSTVEGGYSAVWISGSLPDGLELGAVLRVKATVKEHGDYQGEKQTKLSRLKVLSIKER